MVPMGQERGGGLHAEWHDAEKSNAEKRHATVAAATRTVGANARRGVAEEGAFCPKG